MTQDPAAVHAAFVKAHIEDYLGSGGAKGHLRSLAHVGVPHLLTTLLLKTIGRKSGAPLIAPLIYAPYADGFVIIASKGGAPEHPAWFLNLEAKPEVEFQIATQAFRGPWRILEGAERAGAWAEMSSIYPPYDDYQKKTGGRIIPVVLMKAETPIPVFTA
jgi:deazaflavin-dependent oxidoreductase (nitroreductase family)